MPRRIVLHWFPVMSCLTSFLFSFLVGTFLSQNAFLISGGFLVLRWLWLWIFRFQVPQPTSLISLSSLTYISAQPGFLPWNVNCELLIWLTSFFLSSFRVWLCPVGRVCNCLTSVSGSETSLNVDPRPDKQEIRKGQNSQSNTGIGWDKIFNNQQMTQLISNPIEPVPNPKKATKPTIKPNTRAPSSASNQTKKANSHAKFQIAPSY